MRGGQRFVSVPYSLELNDTIAYVVNKIEPRRYGQMIKDSFDRLYAEGAESGTVMCIPTHNYQVSCPHRLKAFEDALKLRPDSVDAWVALSDLYHDAGQRKQALAVLEEALKRTGDHPKISLRMEELKKTGGR